MRKIIICIIFLSMNFQIWNAQTFREKIREDIQTKIETKKENIRAILEERLSKRIEKKLAKFDSMPDKKRIKNYNKILSNINIALKNKNLTKKQRILFIIIKEIVIEKRK